MTGLYLPGSGLLHRTPPGAKLLALALLTSVLVALRSPLAVAGGVLVVAAAAVVGRVPAGAVVAPLRPLRWVAILLVVFQVLTGGWRAAVTVVGTLLVAVAAAGLVTVTTRVSDLLDVLVRLQAQLRRAGVDPERVGLVLALTIRSVPVLAGLVAEVRDARRSRGLEHSLRALRGPVAVRGVRHADRLGEALTARGVDD
jgi:biotin transport system permease protein